MTQLDVGPTGDQAIVGSTPKGSALLHYYEIFSMVILSLLLVQEGHLSVSGKRMCTKLVKRLED